LASRTSTRARTASGDDVDAFALDAARVDAARDDDDARRVGGRRRESRANGAARANDDVVAMTPTVVALCGDEGPIIIAKCNAHLLDDTPRRATRRDADERLASRARRRIAPRRHGSPRGGDR
jgi:hypothetical protein